MDLEVVEILRSVGVWRLAGLDGCLCGGCSLRHIDIDLSCRKSGGGWRQGGFYGTTVRVSSRSLGANAETLAAVAAEVARQLQDGGDGCAIAVRYCTFDEDEGRKCVYCAKPRETLEAYLCPECLVKVTEWGERLGERYGYGTLPSLFPEIP